VAIARFSEHAAVDGCGVWIVAAHLGELFARDQAITALTVAELRRAGTRTSIRSWSRSAKSLEDRSDHRLTTAFVVVVVVNVAAISCQDAYELVTYHGESGLTAHLLPFSVDGLTWIASMGYFGDTVPLAVATLGIRITHSAPEALGEGRAVYPGLWRHRISGPSARYRAIGPAAAARDGG
jgi:hypothetical protein